MSMYEMRDSGSAGKWMMGAVTRNPEGLLLLAAGVALLMRSGRGQPKKRYARTMNEGGREYSGRRERSQTGEGVGEQVAEAARRAGEYVSEATDKVTETARSYASSAADYADETARAAMERSTRMADQARGTADYVVRERPWAVALTGLLAGAAVAAAFPPTRLERRTLGDVGERLRAAAGAAGEQVMEAGMKAGERLTEVTEERGLTREGLKEAAREVSETFNSVLAGEEKDSAQAPNQTQTRQPLQAGGGTKSSTSKGNRPAGSSSGVMPEGGRR
jgi:ElaB/YqjD/DUF883 family membrane-anchored ribosome-binding protein